MTTLVTCPICERQMKGLSGHIIRRHSMSMEEFNTRYPNTQMFSSETIEKMVAGRASAHAKKTSEQLHEFASKMSKTMSKCYQEKPAEYKEDWSKRSSNNMNSFISGMTTEELEAYRLSLSEKAKKQDLTKFQTSGRAGWKNKQENMSDEEKKAYSQKCSISHKDLISTYSEEELENLIKRVSCNGHSKIEKEVIKYLSSVGISIHPKFKVGRYQIDVFLTDANLALEVYGDYWHSHPQMFDSEEIHPTTHKTVSAMWERDYKRTKYIQEKGYDVAIVWECDLHKLWISVVVDAVLRQYRAKPSGKLEGRCRDSRAEATGFSNEIHAGNSQPEPVMFQGSAGHPSSTDEEIVRPSMKMEEVGRNVLPVENQ